MTKVRTATSTVNFVEVYCHQYRDLFSDVRSYEHFVQLHIGMLSDLKRKTLPTIANLVQRSDAQALHNFLASAQWQVNKLRVRRLELLRLALDDRPFILCIESTSDKKKGNSTDYVAYQYAGDLERQANSIVSVNAYGVLDYTSFPLLFKVYKPPHRFLSKDSSRLGQDKTALAIEIIQILHRWGFRFDVILTDYDNSERSFFGHGRKNSKYLHVLEKLDLSSSHADCSDLEVRFFPNMPTFNDVQKASPGDQFSSLSQLLWSDIYGNEVIRLLRNRSFEERMNFFSSPLFEREDLLLFRKQNSPFIKELKKNSSIQHQAIFGQKPIGYHPPTEDIIDLFEEPIWYVWAQIEGDILKADGNPCELLTFIEEYRFKQYKYELGWNDYRVTDYSSIERWWEIIFCVYQLISFYCSPFQNFLQEKLDRITAKEVLRTSLTQQPSWNRWKDVLTNFRSILTEEISR